MKLKNKKTGKIICLTIKCEDGGELRQFNVNANEDKPITLAELNEEWEDYEEPKEFWFIGEDSCVHSENDTVTQDFVVRLKSIGNYFGTEEEAERAVEKLKAWKRLKEAGAEFYGWRRNQTGTYELYMRWYDRIPRSYEVKKDLDLLFGGEE